MVARFHYDNDTLDRLRLDRLRDDERDVLEHVEGCPACQEQLDSLSQAGLSWGEVGNLLRPGMVPRESLAANSSFNNKRSDSPQPALLFSENYLDSTDHSESLGRFARYEIMELLGRGGMGIVMRGYDTSLHRHSAIKVLAPELATSAAARKRFSREAKSAAAVVHPHVVPIQTVDEHKGLPYLVMPVVEGQSLQQRVEQDGPLSIIETIRIATQVAEGLGAAHDQGLVHRDIKPANVLLENGVERVQITDFGLARAIDDASMTRSGVIAGTPQYMSPEQAHGDTIDHRSDLFSLGSVMYFMLSGRSPFRAETTMGVLNRIGNDVPTSISSVNADVPTWLDEIVTKLLSKSPDDRFQTAEELATLLQDWHAHLQQPQLVPPPDCGSATGSKAGPTAAEGRVLRAGIANRLLVAAGFAFFAGLAFLVVLEMNKGTLTIESDVSDLPIRIMRGDEVVQKLKIVSGAESIRIAAGNYVVELDGEFDEMEVSDASVSLARGGNELVKVVRSSVQDFGEYEAMDETETPATMSGAALEAGSAEQEWAELQTVREGLDAAYGSAVEEASDEDELNRVYQEMDSRQIMPAKYLAFEENHRGTKLGLTALIEAANIARSVGDPTSNAAKGRVEAVDRLSKHYLDHEGLEKVADSLGSGPFFPQANSFLQMLVEKSPYRVTQAEALIAQIIAGKDILTAKQQLPAIRKSMSWRLEEATPKQREGIQDMLAILEKTDTNKLRVELNEKIERLAERYSDVSVQHYGTGGSAAKRLSHTVNRVVVGQQAPEIVATDINGNSFRLSELREKTVVLVFTQSIGDDYGELYAPLRQLAAKYRQFPVRIVGVMSNVDQANLQSASKRGDLDWTVLPQPLNGPLQLDWGIEGYPSVYVVDAKGILHPQLAMPYWGAGGYDTREIDEKLEALLRRDRLANSAQKAKESSSSKQLTTVAEVESQIAAIVKDREKIKNAIVELNLRHRGSYTANRRYQVWIDGNQKRSDCRGAAQDGSSNDTHLTGPTFSLYEDRLNPRNSQFALRDPEKPVGWGTLGTVIDVAKIGLVNWNVESLHSHAYDEDLLPENRTNMRVELGEHNGEHNSEHNGEHNGDPITIVKMDCSNENTIDSWYEFWLSPSQGNYPVYIASGWTDKNSPKQQYVISQHTRWKQIDEVWFPISVKYRYRCDDRSIEDSSEFELISARFNVAPFPEVFDPTNFVIAGQLTEKKNDDSLAVADDDPFSMPTRSEVDARIGADLTPGIFGSEDHESTKQKVIEWLRQSQSKIAAERHTSLVNLSMYVVPSQEIRNAILRLSRDPVSSVRATACHVLFQNADKLGRSPREVMQLRYLMLRSMVQDDVHSETTLPFMIETIKKSVEAEGRIIVPLLVQMVRQGNRKVVDQLIREKDDPKIVDQNEYNRIIETLKDELTRMAKAKLESASPLDPTEQSAADEFGDADPFAGKGADPFRGASQKVAMNDPFDTADPTRVDEMQNEVASENNAPKSPAIVAQSSPIESRINQALDAKTSVDFRDTPLRDALQTLSQKHKISIVLNQQALEEIGLSADLPVSHNLMNVSLRSILRILLGKHDLETMIQDEILQVTTKAQMRATSLSRKYPIGQVPYEGPDIVRNLQKVLDALTVEGDAKPVVQYLRGRDGDPGVIWVQANEAAQRETLEKLNWLIQH